MQKAFSHINTKQNLKASSNYYPFGMQIQKRSYSATSYRFGFNGKELDPEGMGGGGATYDYGFRIYNPALGKFLSVDPLTCSYPSLTPYQFAANMPIVAIDLDGLEAVIQISSVTVSKAFLRIQKKEGTEAAVKFLENKWMNKKHTKDNKAWIKTISGSEPEKVIIVGDEPGLPETLIVYTLEMTGPKKAIYTEHKFQVASEDVPIIVEKAVEELSSIEKLLNVLKLPEYAPPGKSRRANWLDRFIDKYTDYDVLLDMKDIFGWGLEGNPNTVDFTPDEDTFDDTGDPAPASSDNSSLKEELKTSSKKEKSTDSTIQIAVRETVSYRNSAGKAEGWTVETKDTTVDKNDVKKIQTQKSNAAEKNRPN